MINYIVKYFTLNRRERNGMLFLISLIFVLAIVKYFVVYHYQTKSEKVVVVELDSIAAKLSLQNMMSPKNNYVTAGFDNTKKENLFYFDPNVITGEQALQLGFSEKAARTFIKYRNAGAKFYKAEDLKKVYGVTEYLFEKLKPYILIEKPKAENKYQKQEPKQQQQITIEINSADSIQWMSLRGIGPGYTRRILKYKSILGGFTSIEQIKEVYYFPDSVYTAIKNNLTCNPALIQKLKVNSVDFKTLVHHPYIKYEGTKCIFALKRNKKIKAEDLINSSCFSREHLQKVLAYLDFEE